MQPKTIALLILFINSLFFVTSANAQNSSYTKTNTGLVVTLNPSLSGNAKTIKLEVVSEDIIHVIASPKDEILSRQSLITNNYKNAFPANWQVKETAESFVLSTSKLNATVNRLTGAVAFTDNKGNPLINERTYNGRELRPVILEGQSLYSIKQTFETTAGDAYYGLGQHQDGVFNYNGKQVYLFQNNTEVAVPFLISNKNYGILWDNYSVTTVGDIRNYQPLHDLALFDKKGEQGWLTATYFNDKNNTQKITFEKAESNIDYAFLNATKLNLAKEFDIANGMITWEGAISSGTTGVHVFKCSYAGYLKVWIDGQLQLDRWRQAWNPGTGLINLQMQKNKKYNIKIEWIPDGGESYISCKWLPPANETDKNAFSFSAEAGQQVDYYFIYGNNMDDVIAGYRNLTGKATIVPKWAMGFWQSRERYKTQTELLQTVDEFRKRKIPIDNIVLDWSYWKQADWGSQEFDAARFSNPDSMVNVLHKKYHTNIMISVWPKFYEGIPAYKKFNDSGWLYKRNIANQQRDWIAQGYTSTFYDAFNEKARKGFWNLIHDKIYTKGFDAWWMDASEPDILSNVDAQTRKELMTPTALGTAAEYLNAYPLENARGIYEGQRNADTSKRVFILTRSGFAGSQRYGAAIWSGDIASRWTDMKAQISAGLNFSMSGIPFWTMDIGGFSVEKRFENAQGTDLEEWREQMTRWYQFGAFCPLFRVHGQFPYREIFNTAPENHPAYKSMLYYDELRYRLMPYIYTLAGMTYHKNYTIMRGLVMDFAADTAVNNIGDQFMFGPSLLINPVYNYKATNKNLYLPAGTGWYNFYTGEYVKGGQHIIADAPYERIPIYAKEGSIIPVGPAIQYTDEKPADTITLIVYTGANASFTLYEDEGINYNYEKGAFSNITITYNESTKKISIGKREGSFKGMLQKRVFNIKWVTKSNAVGFNANAAADATVRYNGNAVDVTMH